MNSQFYINTLNLIPHPEGGFFREIFRSGSVDSMKTCGQTDLTVPSNYRKDNQTSAIVYEPGLTPRESLVCCPERVSLRPDGEIRRNCLTSIIWMPVLKHPVLSLCINTSDHVLYWQGGLRMQCYIYCPETGSLEVHVLGSQVSAGDELQIAVPGGSWKAGELIPDPDNLSIDFSLVGEAVAPGFDFHDFAYVTETNLSEVPNPIHRRLLRGVLSNKLSEVSGREATHAIPFYDELFK